MAQVPLAPVAPDVEVVVMQEAEEQVDPPHHVFIHNDDITPFDFVVGVLVDIFELTEGDAWRIAYKTHFTGKAYVTTLGLEVAKYKVSQATSRARANQYPLSFTIEPAN